MIRKFLCVVLLSLLEFQSNGQTAPTWNWTRDVVCSGTTANSNAFGITTDANGNVFLAGYFQTSVTLGATTRTSVGGNDALIIKYDTQGNIVWSATGGGTGMDNANCVAVDASGNVYVAGFFTTNATFGSLSITNPNPSYSQIFLAKYDSLGTVQWVRTGGGSSNDYAEDLAIDAAGNVYMAGSYQSSTQFGMLTTNSAGLQDAFLVKYDPNGNAIWLRTGSGRALDNGYGVGCDNNGGVYFTGFFSDTATFSGQSVISAGGYDVYWAKYDTAGNLLYLHRAGGTASDYGYSIAVHPSGDIHLTGGFSNTVVMGSDTLVSAGFSDAFLVRCDPAGDPVTASRFGGSGNDFGYDVVRTSAYGATVSGYFDGPFTVGNTVFPASFGSRDAFVAGFDFYCNNQWAVRAGGSGLDQSFAVATDPSDAVFFSGNYTGTAAFGPTTLSCGTRSSVYLSKLRSCDSISVTGTQGFCVTNGIQSLTYTVSSPSSNYAYVWSPTGSTSASITVTPTATTEYTVTADDGAGCIVSATTNAIVESPADFSVVLSDDTICQGNAVNLFADWNFGNSLPAPAGYCPVINGISQADEQILAVSFGSMSNVQQDTCGSNYTDFTSGIPPVRVNRGGAYPFTVVTDECDGAPYYNSGLCIYIDYNRDGDFSDSAEQAYSSAALLLAPNTRTGTITIPSWATPGTTRMRVVVMEGIIAPNACLTISYGEAEDYAVEIGTGGLTNSWSDGTQASSFISPTPASTTTYTVTSSSEFGCVATATATVNVKPSPVVSITGPAAVCIPSTFTLDAGSGFSSYVWTANGWTAGSGQTLSDSTGHVLPVQDYTVTVTDSNGCTATDSLYVVYSEEPTDVPVCLVTVDSAGDYNRIIWEKDPVADAVDSFIVYREITTNNFLQIGALPRSAMSIFTDTAVNVNATSYKYKIAWKDTCGNTGPVSLYHNTIHLQYLGFGNLQWTNYEIENTANTVASYNVYRDNTSSGNFQLLQVIPGNNNTFTDINYASYPNAQYRVDVNWLTGGSCNPTARVITTSQSNIRRISTSGTGDHVKSVSVRAYPNPTDGILVVECTDRSLTPGTQAEFMSMDGRHVCMKPVSGLHTSVDVSSWPAGVYSVRIITPDSGNIAVLRFVVE
jgi:hypothetical protein